MEGPSPLRLTRELIPDAADLSEIGILQLLAQTAKPAHHGGRVQETKAQRRMQSTESDKKALKNRSGKPPKSYGANTDMAPNNNVPMQGANHTGAIIPQPGDDNNV